MQNRYDNPKNPCGPPPNTGGCTENDTITQKTINAERKTYCDALTVAAGDVYQWEANFAGAQTLKKKKKCLFVWTEKNYQVFRNLEISTGTSLLQFNESIKDSTANFLKSNKAVYDGLKDIVKKVKDLQSKVYALRDEASGLKNCKNEGCNKTQWGVLTGDWTDCKGGEQKEPPKRPPECNGVKEKFEQLFCLPVSLAGDVDSLYKAAADVVGIQVFANINTLDALQKTLYDNSKAFDKHLQDTMKKDQDELKKAQDDFVKAVQDWSKSKATLFGKRSDFQGIYDTVSFFCCPPCTCVQVGKPCEERLKGCKQVICDICDTVKKTFCECPPPDTDQTKAS